MSGDVGVTEVQQIGASLSSLGTQPGTGAQTGTAATPMPSRTFLPLQIKPGTPPFIRQHKRWDYIAEYVGFEKDRYKNMVKAVFCFSFGLLTLQAFPPGGLLLIALAARFQDMAWWGGFITKTFGKYRSLVLVD